MKTMKLLFAALVALVFSSYQAEGRVRPYSAPGDNDVVTDLVLKVELTDLGTIEEAELLKGALIETPWSGDYWPHYKGILGRRFADPDFPDADDWKVNADYALAKINSSEVSQPEHLSPAEKYDLVVGDAARTLTRVMWTEGEIYHKEYGKVESWMGICEGWAAASFTVPRPLHKIEVMAADGKTMVPFYPDDIKGLISLLWARAPVETLHAGGRCNDKEEDAFLEGRAKRPNCLDSNPATFHLALVNQIGLAKRGLIMDAEWTMEVWNHPIYSYKYKYFNVQTEKEVKTLNDAQVALDEYPEDAYRAHRAPGAKSIVGIILTLRYGVETMPSAVNEDSPERDRLYSVTYKYDLELDDRGQVIGGEWHQAKHPDFLWAVTETAEVISLGDSYLNLRKDLQTWDGKTPIPATWQEVAPRTSTGAQPLARIINTLVNLSRQ